MVYQIIRRENIRERFHFSARHWISLWLRMKWRKKNSGKEKRPICGLQIFIRCVMTGKMHLIWLKSFTRWHMVLQQKKRFPDGARVNAWVSIPVLMQQILRHPVIRRDFLKTVFLQGVSSENWSRECIMRMHSRYLESVEYRKKSLSYWLKMRKKQISHWRSESIMQFPVIWKRQEQFMMICIMMHSRMTVLEQSRRQFMKKQRRSFRIVQDIEL